MWLPPTTKIDNYGTIEASKTAGNTARDVAAIYLNSRADIINRSTGVIKGTGGADGIIVATDVANGDCRRLDDHQRTGRCDLQRQW